MFIDLNKIKANAIEISSKSPLIAVVKADAYGLGAVNIAKALDSIVSGFAVWTCDEAIELRSAGINNDILVLGTVKPCASHSNIIYSVSSMEDLKIASSRRIAINIDTGMNRMGVCKEELDRLLSCAERCSYSVHSVYTHLFCSSDEKISHNQVDMFDEIGKDVNAKKHVCASGGLKYSFAIKYDYVRCGLSLYKDAVTVLARIIKLKDIKRGEYVGYGDIPIDRDICLAVVNIGYRDGYRCLSGIRQVWISGKLCDVIGVCMDVALVDVSDTGAEVGEYVEIVGENYTMSQLAQSYGTTEYESMTFYGRVRKNYVK